MYNHAFHLSLSLSLPPSLLASPQTIFESKRNPAYSEAADSGVGGMTDAEISQVQSIATSQEDLHLITVSPNTSVTDLKLPSFPLPPHPPTSPSHHLPTEDNGGDLSDNESSQTVVEDDESSTPRSNSSLMATVTTASSSWTMDCAFLLIFVCVSKSQLSIIINSISQNEKRYIHLCFRGLFFIRLRPQSKNWLFLCVHLFRSQFSDFHNNVVLCQQWFLTIKIKKISSKMSQKQQKCI